MSCFFYFFLCILLEYTKLQQDINIIACLKYSLKKIFPLFTAGYSSCKDFKRTEDFIHLH